MAKVSVEGGGIRRTKLFIGTAGHSSVSISTTDRLVALLDSSLALDPRRATVMKLRSLVELELLSSAVSEVPLGGAEETGVLGTERSPSDETVAIESRTSAVSEHEEAPSVSEHDVTVATDSTDDDGGVGGCVLQ